MTELRDIVYRVKSKGPPQLQMIQILKEHYKEVGKQMISVFNIDTRSLYVEKVRFYPRKSSRSRPNTKPTGDWRDVQEEYNDKWCQKLHINQ